MSCAALDWPRCNAEVLRRAFETLDQDTEAWCLLTSWRDDVSLERNRRQYRALEEGLALSRCGAFALAAHYRDVESWEPWVFVTRCPRSFATWLVRRLRQPLAFCGDRSAVFVLGPEARRLGDFRPGAIAHAICESSLERAMFLGFDVATRTRRRLGLRSELLDDIRP
jgi:hypothetical protein